MMQRDAFSKRRPFGAESFLALLLLVCCMAFCTTMALADEADALDSLNVEGEPPVSAEEATVMQAVRSVDDFTGLQEAIKDYGHALDDMVIQVAKSFEVPQQVVIPKNENGKTLTIQSADGLATQALTRGIDCTESLFMVLQGAQAITKNIAFDGNKGSMVDSGDNGPLFTIEAGASFTAGEGAVFRNNRASLNGGALRCFGSLTICGGVFTGNEIFRAKEGYGGAVYLEGASASLRFDSGTIGGSLEEEGNHGLNGGGLCIIGPIGGDTREDAFIIGGDARIIGNTAGWGPEEGELRVFGKGAGIYIQSTTVTFLGGTIAGNVAKGATSAGGGVNIYDGRLLMRGGTIGGTSPGDANIAGKGGGICSESMTPNALEVSGSARISGNIAGRVVEGSLVDGYGGGVLMAGDSTMVWTGGLISDNQALIEGSGAGSGIFTIGASRIALSGSPRMERNSCYVESILANAFILQGNLVDASISIEGSFVDGQMVRGITVSAYPGVSAATAASFVSADGALVGAVNGDSVIWATKGHVDPVDPVDPFNPVNPKDSGLAKTGDGLPGKALLGAPALILVSALAIRVLAKRRSLT